jgi:hypothetical protein
MNNIIKTTGIMKKFLLVVLAVIAIAGTSQAQKKQITKGDKAYDKKNWAEAAAYYEEAIKKGGALNSRTKDKQANCYFYLSETSKAEKIFGEVEEDNLSKDGALNFGKIKQQNEDYDGAAKLFTLAITKGANADKIKPLQDACGWAKDNSNPSKEYTAECLELSNIYGSVCFYKEGLAFSYNPSQDKEKKGPLFADIYFATFSMGKVGVPKLFSDKLKFSYPTGALTFSPDAKRLYFTKTAEAKKKDAKLNNKVFETSLEKNAWTEPKIPGFNSDKFSCMHPTWNKDGNIMVFASDMPGGYGGKDLYMVSYKDKKWGKPVNLGDKVNSTGDEVFPHIAADQTLYFASNGLLGFGGLDVYFATFANDAWDNVKNLGKPINTSKDDYGYISNPEDPSNFLMMSGREGADKLYMVIKNEVSASLDDPLTPIDTATNFILPKDEVKNDANMTSENNQNLTLEEQLKNFMTGGSNITYRVQFKSSKQPLDQLKSFQGEIVYRYEFSGLYRYTIGEFYEPAPAIKLKDKLIGMGYKDAFVAAFKGNERKLDVIIYDKSKSGSKTEEKKQ